MFDHVVNNKSPCDDQTVTWASYHANQDKSTPTRCINALLPLFRDDSKSIAIIRHSMDVVNKATEFLNPGQIPCITLDQPLYTLAKQIKWRFPQDYGENKFIIMMGALHTEMSFLKCLGDWLKNSGLTVVLAEADIASQGVTDSMINASHVTRTRHAHQVTSSSLFLLLQEAFQSRRTTELTIEYDKWIYSRCQESPMFCYWYITLLYIVIRSLREGNFQLYVTALSKLAIWYFSLDHIHYARWLPLHISDMVALKSRNPGAYAEFDAGTFVVHKTERTFSGIGTDQAHEQNNLIVKGDGGAIGLTENPAALHRWMVVGSEIARLLTEFEKNEIDRRSALELRHHERTEGAQKKFIGEVKKLTEIIRSCGNPFLEESKELLVLDSRNIVDSETARLVSEIEKIGQKQYDDFVEKRVMNGGEAFFSPIRKNKFVLFGSSTEREGKNAKVENVF